MSLHNYNKDGIKRKVVPMATEADNNFRKSTSLFTSSFHIRGVCQLFSSSSRVNMNMFSEKKDKLTYPHNEMEDSIYYNVLNDMINDKFS